MIEKQEVQEIFPTPLWIVDLQPAVAASLNVGLAAEIERLIAPRPNIPAGSNWQTPQDLHTRPAFAEFVKLVETAAKVALRLRQAKRQQEVQQLEFLIAEARREGDTIAAERYELRMKYLSSEVVRLMNARYQASPR